MSSATWSLRLRAVCSFLPTSPSRSVSTCSTNIWMSSQLGSKSSAPLSRSRRMPSSPPMRHSASCREMMPCSPSMAAWAMLPVMSCRYIRWSKRREELKSSAMLSVTPLVRPAHIFAIASPSLPPRRAAHMYFIGVPAALRRKGQRKKARTPCPPGGRQGERKRGDGGTYFFPSTMACTAMGRPKRLMKPAA